MSEKLYRIRLSTTLDQDVIGFLEKIPTSRRTELLRHILRYYVSQLEPDGELFIVAEATQYAHFPNAPLDAEGKEIKEYKVRLDKSIDILIVELVERVPRKRRSEFWRHVLRYYMSYLPEGEFFIMPSKVVASEVPSVVVNKEEELGEEPNQEMLGNFSF